MNPHILYSFISNPKLLAALRDARGWLQQSLNLLLIFLGCKRELTSDILGLQERSSVCRSSRSRWSKEE